MHGIFGSIGAKIAPLYGGIGPAEFAQFFENNRNCPLRRPGFLIPAGSGRLSRACSYIHVGQACVKERQEIAFVPMHPLFRTWCIDLMQEHHSCIAVLE
jgi:hypothetical protein